jgi:hypothetical protein
MTFRKADESLVSSDKTDSFFEPALLRLKTSKMSESSMDEKMYCLYIVLNKDSTVIIFYLFSSALFISLNFPFICVPSFLSFRATF